jgi:serine/threonine protein kinase
MGAVCSNTTRTEKIDNVNSKYIILFKANLTKNSFDFIHCVGKGGFGKVWKVYSKKYKKFYGLKEMSKALIIDKKSEKSIIYERDLLTQIQHPYNI